MEHHPKIKKIVFRADAKPSIGTGDLVSLINLSRYFERNGWDCYFIIKNYSTAVEIANSYKVRNLFSIDSNVSMKEETSLINNYIEKHDINVIFIEITERPIGDYNLLAGDIMKACVSFSTDIPPDMDLVVNWDVNAADQFEVSKYPKTKFLLGPEYVILPVNFDEALIKNRVYKARPQTLLITMGGADEFNFTEKIIRVLGRYKIDLKLNIITGAGYKFTKELKRTLSPFSQYEVKRNITDMFSEYMKCDIAIASGGLTAYELVAARTPVMLIAVYEHQAQRCLYFDKMGTAKYMGFRTFDENTLIKTLNMPAVMPPNNIFRTDDIRKAADELLERHYEKEKVQ